MIKYVSTKGGVSPVNFDEAVLQGFAEDGGLFVPDTIPVVSREHLRGIAQRALSQARAESELKPAATQTESQKPGFALLDWLLAPVRQPMIAAAVAGIFIVGGLLGWNIKPQAPVTQGREY